MKLVLGLTVSILLVVTPIRAASYAVTVQTDKAAYTDADSIQISGNVTPAPGAGTGVFITVINPNGKDVDFGAEAVDGTTGSFSHKTVAGGMALWISGTYTVNASWGAIGVGAFKTTTFQYTVSTTTTSSSTSTEFTSTPSTSTSSTSSSGTISTSTTTSSTSTASTSSTIPEFNPQALLFVALIAFAAVAALGRTSLIRRKSMKP